MQQLIPSEQIYYNYLCFLFGGLSLDCIEVLNKNMFELTIATLKSGECREYKASRNRLIVSSQPTRGKVIVVSEGILKNYCEKYNLVLPAYKLIEL